MSKPTQEEVNKAVADALNNATANGYMPELKGMTTEEVAVDLLDHDADLGKLAEAFDQDDNSELTLCRSMVQEGVEAYLKMGNAKHVYAEFWWADASEENRRGLLERAKVDPALALHKLPKLDQLPMTFARAASRQIMDEA